MKKADIEEALKGRAGCFLYLVFAGEAGNEQGHFCGAGETLHGAQWLAERARRAYGDGWSLIVNDKTKERYVEGRTRL